VILRSAASVTVTAGLKWAPETPPREAISIISTNAWRSPITAKSVNPSPPASAGELDARMKPMNRTRRNVPISSATYAAGSLGCMARSVWRTLAVALIAPLALFAVGCGSGLRTGEDRPERPATLVLDFAPNAVHAGVYTALDRDFDGAEGVTLRVRAPSSSTDAVKLLLAGRAQLAILDIHDLALARQRGRDVVGVMAVVQRPLAAVLARPGVRRPRDLAGRSAGVTGLPSDEAVLRSIVAGDGGDPDRVRRVTIGFQAV
jgi:NMT1/THI5 like